LYCLYSHNTLSEVLLYQSWVYDILVPLIQASLRSSRYDLWSNLILKV